MVEDSLRMAAADPDVECGGLYETTCSRTAVGGEEYDEMVRLMEVYAYTRRQPRYIIDE